MPRFPLMGPPHSRRAQWFLSSHALKALCSRRLCGVRDAADGPITALPYTPSLRYRRDGPARSGSVHEFLSLRVRRMDQEQSHSAGSGNEEHILQASTVTKSVSCGDCSNRPESGTPPEASSSTTNRRFFQRVHGRDGESTRWAAARSSPQLDEIEELKSIADLAKLLAESASRNH